MCFALGLLSVRTRGRPAFITIPWTVFLSFEAEFNLESIFRDRYGLQIRVRVKFRVMVRVMLG